MQEFKTTFITTFINEEDTMGFFLHSLFIQTINVHEIILVDGGSTDKTLEIVNTEIEKLPAGYKKQTIIKVFVRKGNRAVGRNAAIEKATGSIILSSDAGCVLDKDWVKNITKPFQDTSVDVVAGYYKGEYKTIFEKCLIPYVLVMPDKVDPQNFLPATRSMAFKKSVWEKIGGFSEKYAWNEDYVFAQKLKEEKAKIVFAKNAIVAWIPRKNIAQAYTMFYNFAYGDIEAGIMRPKVVLLFVRYFVGIALLVFYLQSQNMTILYLILTSLIAYGIWSIKKNYRYVEDFRAFFFLPLLQITADIAVILGTVAGLLKKVFK